MQYCRRYEFSYRFSQSSNTLRVAYLTKHNFGFAPISFQTSLNFSMLALIRPTSSLKSQAVVLTIVR